MRGAVGPVHSGDAAGATLLRPDDLSVHAILELCGSVWGEVWFPAHLRTATFPYDIPLFASGANLEFVQNDAREFDLAKADVRGEIAFRVDWSPTGARLEVLCIRGLTLPVGRIGEMLHPEGEVEWQFRMEVAPPGEGAPVPVCSLKPNSVPVLLTEHVLVFERVVELQWPPDWLSIATGKTDDDTDPTWGGIAAEVVKPPPPINTITRLRRAMLEGGGSRASARSLKQWAMNETWFLFSPPYSRYDEWLLPIDELTANFPHGDFCLAPEDLTELRADQHYLKCHEHVARMILLSWGWDATADVGVEPLDNEGGQGWHASGALNWRLRHLCLSLRLFSQHALLESVHRFVKAMGPIVPWGENGFGEVAFTLGDASAKSFWESEKRLRNVPYRCLLTESRDRTLREILFTQSAWDA